LILEGRARNASSTFFTSSTLLVDLKENKTTWRNCCFVFVSVCELAIVVMKLKMKSKEMYFFIGSNLVKLALTIYKFKEGINKGMS
jgi:hypothetical protein